MNQTAEIKKHLRAQGADLVGIAGIGRFDGVAPEHHPSSIFPETRSVITVGFFIPRGTLRGIEEGSYFMNYSGMTGLSDNWMPWFFHRVMGAFEDRGWEAVPIFPHAPAAIMNQGLPVAPGKPAPNVAIEIEQAATRAGLGDIGYHGMFLTPEYGPLQKMMVILTDATLTQDPLPRTPVCDMCMACAKACPLHALDPKKKTTVTVAGRKMAVGKLNLSRCRRCQNGAQPARLPNTPPDRIPALCGRECLIHLEKKGALKHRWKSAFRRRPPWVVVDDEPVSLEEQRRAAELG